MGALRTWSGWKHSSHKPELLCVGVSRCRSRLSFRIAPRPAGEDFRRFPDTLPVRLPALSAMSQIAASDSGSQDYVVVARRYRPQDFDELIGQEHVAQALKRAIAKDRVGHAYLFTGARGVGKTSAARILAKALNCEQGTSPTPCNTCEICTSIGSGDDVDVLEIDGASNRGIDEIRQLRQNVAVRPSRARLKIYIIDEVHMLTKEAFNALLKTLEEPPEHVKFIFATTEANKIPITILSRCQRFDFAGIESTAIQARLAQIATAEGVDVDPDALQILSMRAAGSMRDSQSLLEQLLSGGSDHITAEDVAEMLGIAPAAQLSKLIKPLVARDAREALREFDQAIAAGADASQLIDQLLGYFRDAMTQAVGCDPEQMLYAMPSQHVEVRTNALELGVHTVLAIVQVLDQASARMRVSTNTRVLAEMAIVRICHLENLETLAKLLTALREGTSVPALSTAESSAGVKKNGVAKPAAAVGDESAIETPPASTPSTESSPHSPEPTKAPVAEQPPELTAVAETEASASTLSLADVSAEEIWQRALASLSSLLADSAAQAEEVALRDNQLQLTFSNSFYKQQCERPENRSQLETALEQACGQRVGIDFKLVKSTETSAPRRSRVAERREQQAEVLAQPFVKRAMELFEGDTQRVRIVPPPETT